MTEELIARHRRVRDQNFQTNDLAAAVMPILSYLRNQYPVINYMILGTGDGLHVCSLGFSRTEDASSMAALNASMLGISKAQGQLLDPLYEEDIDTVVTIQMPGDKFLAMAKVEHAPVGHLVIGFCASSIQLGMVVRHVQDVAERITKWIKEQ